MSTCLEYIKSRPINSYSDQEHQSRSYDARHNGKCTDNELGIALDDSEFVGRGLCIRHRTALPRIEAIRVGKQSRSGIASLSWLDQAVWPHRQRQEGVRARVGANTA